MRNKAAVSGIRDFTEQKFRPVLEEPTYTAGDGNRNKVRRVLLTSGKIYYELAAHKAKDKRDDVAIALIEQLAALPRRRLAETLDRYPNVEEKFWVQEESANGRLAQVRPGAARAVSRQVGRHQADFAVVQTLVARTASRRDDGLSSSWR